MQRTPEGNKVNLLVSFTLLILMGLGRIFM